MQFSAFALLALCGLRSVIAFTGNEHAIFDLKTHQASPSDANDVNNTVSFTFFDPDPLSEESTECERTWPKDQPQGYNTGGFACDNPEFNFSFNAYTNISNFELQTTHTLHDPSVGQPPYDYTTTYARGVVSTPANVTCITGGDGSIDCDQNEGSVIATHIYAAVA